MSHPAAVLRSVASCPPGEPVPQAHLRQLLTNLWIGSDAGLRTALAVFDTSGVHTRHFALPLEAYPALTGFAERNARFLECARALNAQAARRALERADLTPDDVTHVVFVTSTGIATPRSPSR